MPVDPQPSHREAGRADTERAARRPLLTARTTGRPASRVVLHLPDLDLLQGLALGPPRKAAYRLDAAHEADERVPQSHLTAKRESSAVSDSQGAASGGWLKKLQLPLSGLAGNTESTSTLGRVGRWLVYLQQPKMILAGVTAVAVQLTVVLAMLTGGSTESNTGKTGDATSGAAAQWPPQFAGHLPTSPQQIQPGFNGAYPGSTAAPWLPPSGPPLVAGPPTPPPSPAVPVLPAEMPAWPQASTPIAAGRATGSTSGPALALPTPSGAAGPSDDSPAAAVDVAGHPSASPVKARLMGTIRRSPTRGDTP